MPITINGSTGLAGVDGSDATPAIQGTDTNTGITFPASDIVAISANGVERLRVLSSGLLVGTTSTTSPGIRIFNDSGTAGRLNIFKTASGTYDAFALYHNVGYVGGITYSNTATAYLTSSDYRLKNDVQPIENALDTVSALNPVTWKWKLDGSAGQGFIAHELQTVVPDCVVGEKDAVDEDGKPRYQGVDTSFLVATLTKAIQELNAKVEGLQAEINALKGAA